MFVRLHTYFYTVQPRMWRRPMPLRNVNKTTQRHKRKTTIDIFKTAETPNVKFVKTSALSYKKDISSYSVKYDIRS